MVARYSCDTFYITLLGGEYQKVVVTNLKKYINHKRNKDRMILLVEGFSKYISPWQVSTTLGFTQTKQRG